MHEAALLSAAVATLTHRTGGRVAEVVLEIGPDVDPSAAEAAWQTAVEGTPLAGARVRFVPAADTLSCLDCGEDYRGDRHTHCPHCNGNGLVVHPADDLAIRSWTPA